MRLAARSKAAWGLAAVVCVAVGLALLLWVVFPWMVGGESFRESASATLGAEVNYSDIELAYFPPTIVLDELTLVGVGGSARADRVVLEISLAPLLARIVLVDSVTVEGAVITLVRSRDGVQGVSAQRGGASERTEADAKLRFAVRALSIPDATVILEDRTVSPTLAWEIRQSNLQMELRLQSNDFERTAHFELVGEIATGGRIDAKGEISANGDVHARVRLEAVSIAHARPYFAVGADVDGVLTGTITAVGRQVEFDFALRDGRLKLGEISLQGPMKITGRIDGSQRPPGGQVELDATAAELRYGDFFTKPPGTRARVRGEVTSGTDGTLRIDTWKFEMENFDGRV